MTKLSSIATAAASLVLLLSGSAFAQVNSGTGQNVALNATLAESLTVSLTTSAVNFALTAGSATNAGNVPISATTTWSLNAGRTSVKLFAYFDAAATAMQLNGVFIPSPLITAQVNAGTAVPFTTATLFSPASGI